MTSFVQASPTATRKSGEIKLHGPEAFAGMRRAGRLAAEALDLLVDFVKPGLSTNAIDRFVLEFALSHNAFPATLLYRGYRYSVCTSINHVVCHGMPSDKPLREGDIVNIDLTLLLDGWHGDSSRMYPIGAIGRRAERLLEVTHEALMRGIAAVSPAARPAISARPSRNMRRPSAARWCAISVDTASAGCSTTSPISFTTGEGARACR